MKHEIAAMDATQLDLLLDLKCGETPDYTITDKGIIFNPNVPEEKWLEVTERAAADLTRTGNAHVVAMFRVGDSLRFGEDKFGERYAQAIDLSKGIMAQHAKTILNAAWIAGRVAPEVRHVDTLTLTHHEIVAPYQIEEQREYLDWAEAENATTKELKGKVREKHPAKRRSGKAHAAKSLTEAAALKSSQEVLVFLQEAIETEKYADWPKDRKTKWAPWLEEILKLSRRCVQNGHRKA